MTSENVRSHGPARTYRVNWIHAFSPFIPLAFDPMPIEICEKTVDIIGTGGVPLPLASVVAQERLVLQRLGFLDGLR